MFKSIFRLKPANARLFSSEAGASSAAAAAAPNWAPKKRVSRPTMEKIRALAASQPEVYNVVTLSKEFKLSVEGVRRILKSKYVPEGQDGERQEKNRYEAMGERRKEFKKTYNIPDENPKKFWTQNTTRKVQDISTRREDRGGNSNWTNDMYKKRSFGENENRRPRFNNEDGRPQRYDNEDGRPQRYNRDQEDGRPQRFNRDQDDRRPYNQRFDRDGPRSNYNGQPRRNSFRNDQGEQRPYNGNRSRSFDGERRPYNGDRSRSADSERRPYNGDRSRSFDSERRPFKRDNADGERRPYRNNNFDSDRKPFNRDTRDGEKRPFNRFNGDNRGDRSFNDRKPFRRNDNQGKQSFDRTRDDNNAASGRDFKSDE